MNDLIFKYKTNKSMAAISFVVTVLPVLARILVELGYPEWADIVIEIVKILAPVFGVTGFAGLVAKNRRGEPVFK